MTRSGERAEPAMVGVQILEAKPNKLFTEEQREIVRFLRYTSAVPCAECGKRRKLHWTLLWSFKAKTMPKRAFVLQDSGKIHLPLTPVCTSHLLGHPDEERRGPNE
jgi:hypothetical protein